MNSQVPDLTWLAPGMADATEDWVPDYSVRGATNVYKSEYLFVRL